MCFDIDVTKLSLQELRETLSRITMLLSKPTVVNNLPDKGHQLRQVKEKLQQEIEFRENLELTRQKMQTLSLHCASDTNIVTSHGSKLCSMEKKPERERFKPHLTLRSSASGKTESLPDVHTGTKLIDLKTSLSLQKRQEERVKAEQVRAKQERLVALMKQNNEGTDDSDTDEIAPDFNPNDSTSDEEKIHEDDAEHSGDEEYKKDLKQFLKEIIFTAEARVKEELDLDEPGPSHIKVKKEPNSPEKNIQSIAAASQLQIEAVELKGESGKSEKNIQPNTDITQVKVEVVELDKEPEKAKEEVQPTADNELTGEVEIKKEPSEPKDEGDMA